MQEIVLETLIYIIDNPLLSLVTAVAAGFLATRIVAADRRPGAIGFTIIGLLGFLVSHFMITYAGWNEYLESLHELRLFIDVVAAFVGSFVIAGTVHFLKPS